MLWYISFKRAVELSQTAQLFMNGRSQAVRLPASYRFSSKEVYIRRDPDSGDVILSRKPPTWDTFLLALKNAHVPIDFLDKKEREQASCDQDPFEGWEE